MLLSCGTAPAAATAASKAPRCPAARAPSRLLRRPRSSKAWRQAAAAVHRHALRRCTLQAVLLQRSRLLAFRAHMPACEAAVTLWWRQCQRLATGHGIFPGLPLASCAATVVLSPRLSTPLLGKQRICICSLPCSALGSTPLGSTISLVCTSCMHASCLAHHIASPCLIIYARTSLYSSQAEQTVCSCYASGPICNEITRCQL